jgi:hypothetical protein
MANVADHMSFAVVGTVMSPLKDGDHYVLRKLSIQIFPWIICGRRLQNRWLVRLASFYDYTSNLAAALAGLGIGAPIATLISTGKVPEGKSALQLLQEALPQPWSAVGIVALIVWILLRVFVQKQDIIGRALLARDCAHTMRGLNLQLFNAFPDVDPMPTITKIQKSVDDQVANAIRNKIWPWDPLPPQSEFEVELKNTIDSIRASFMSGWAAPPAKVV